MIDFLVIGGGIAGLSAGARLAPQGTVCVLEAEMAIGYHASGRSAALFEPNYGNAAVRELNRASEDYLRDTEGGYLTPRGFLLVGMAETADLFAGDLAQMGCPEISVDEALTRVPILRADRITRAAYNAGAEDIDTDRMLHGFAREIRRHAGQVATTSRVTGIRRTATGWEVDAGETHAARLLVNAAGPWADRIAQMSGIAPVGITPYRRSMARLAPPGGHDVSSWPMIFGAGETWYAKPDAGHLIVSPADEDPSEPMDAWPDDMVLAEGLARYQDHVTEEVTRPTATWAGLRSFAPDRTLVLGPDPTDPGFVWSAGQGGYGFQTAPAASTLVAQLTIGERPDLPADTVAAINLDAFGFMAGPTEDMVVVGHGSSELEEILAATLEASGRYIVEEPTPEAGYYYRSDHFNFARGGIPSLYAKSGVEHVELGAEHVLAIEREYRENRYHKPGDVFDPEATLLGDRQEHWLMSGLIRSQSQWNILGQQVMMGRVDRIPGKEEGYSMDQWAGYDVPRRRLLEFISQRRIPNPVVLTGDIHTNWANDLKVDFDKADDPTVATEFVATSLASGGNGAEKYDGLDQVLAENPFVKFHNAERGYVTCSLTSDEWRADFQVIDEVEKPGGKVSTRASFVVENGKPGIQEA